MEDINSYISKGKTAMDESIEHLNKELNNIRAGKASPSMLSSVMVEYYGNPTPLNQVANVTAADSRTLSHTTLGESHDCTD